MNKNLIFALFFVLLALPGKACDVCGAGAGGQFFGVLPVLEGRYASLRSQQQLFKHPATAENMLNGEALTYDHLQSVELWLRWQLDDRWQLILQLPYRQHQRWAASGVAASIQGAGDAQLTAFYKILSPKAGQGWGHGLSGGLQLIAPTGLYQQRDEQRRLLPEPFQLGGGAWGSQLQGFYTLSKNNRGWQLEGRVRAFAPNELDYQRGTAMGSSLQYFANVQGKRLRWMYYGGMTVDQVQPDRSYGQLKGNTGGSLWGLSAGIDLYTAKSAFHLMAQTPFYQEVYAAQPVNLFRALLGYSRSF